MVMQYFVLDLRSLSAPLLRDLKQSLLQLSNFYAISAPINDKHKWTPLSDRIGLCYIVKNRISCVNELKIAYCPRGNFSLRDFHCAVNNLPTDAFLPEFNNSGALFCSDIQLSSIFSDNVLYSRAGNEKDISKKVIVISSSLVENLDPAMKRTLMEAADKCVSVEFVLLEQKSGYLEDVSEKINNFAKQIYDLENCSVQSYFPDERILNGLVKRWLQDLKDDIEEPLQAHFIFKSELLGSLNHISCKLCSSFNHTIDDFIPCQTCRCHGIPLDDANAKKLNRPSCPVSGENLGKCDMIESSVKVGTQTVLFMPNSWCCQRLQNVSSHIEFNVIERANLGSLSEGLIFGTPYIVTPSNFHDSDDIEKSDLNIQFFQGLCYSLHSMDQGLICTSNCNMETISKTSFHCYYILLPAEKGLMLLRRLAGSEEVFPIPDVNQLIDSSVPKEIQSSIQACLLEMDVTNYDPFRQERGFHHKLNLLVRESTQFGAIPLKPSEVISEPNSGNEESSIEKAPSKQATSVAVTGKNPKEAVLSKQETSTKVAEENLDEIVPSKQTSNSVIIEEETPELECKAGDDSTTACIAEEWEQLIVMEVPKRYSPTCIPKPKLDQSILSQLESGKQVDEKTSRILERLEVPRQLKTEASSPVIPSNLTGDASMFKKNPLVSLIPIHTSDQRTTASQPMKPNFQRLKRKLR